VQALVAARLENKSTLAESRAESFIEAARYGEFPVSYLYSGAQTTHRLSGGGGFNMQNLPRGGPLRDAIMAPPGHVLCVGDLRQVELRATLALAAEFIRVNGFDEAHSEEYKALHMLADGADLYCDFGTELYGRTITKADSEDRHVAKECVLGSGYQMGAKKLVTYLQGKNVRVTPEFAQRAIDVYRGRFKGVQGVWKYLQEVFKNALANPEQDYQLFKMPDVWLAKEPLYGDRAVRIPPQGLYVKYPNLRMRPRSESDFGGLCYDRAKDGTTGLFGGKILQNMIECLTRNIIMEKTLEVRKIYKVVMQTHDELVCVVPEGEDGDTFVTEVLERGLTWWPALPLNAEVKSAKRYGAAK
jgi:DNA polymerase I-like protein with 3'-5' exonuclease and polymerase domains